jgi:hypothetical protein
MSSHVETSTPANTPVPIVPYNLIAKVGEFITIGGTAGVDPRTGQLTLCSTRTLPPLLVSFGRAIVDNAG